MNQQTKRQYSTENQHDYRQLTGLKIVEERPAGEKEFAFDTQWDKFLLELQAKDFVTYSVNCTKDGSKAIFEGILESDALVEISQNGKNQQKIQITKNNATKEFTFEIELISATKVEVQIKGCIWLRKIDFK